MIVREDLVEGGAPEADVVDLGAGVVDGRTAAEMAARPPSTGRVTRRAASSMRGSSWPSGASAATGREVLDPAGVDLDDVAAAQGLQLVGRAVGDDPAVVDDHDLWASWSASSRYWVVSSTSVPWATRLRIASHSSAQAAGVEARGGLVEQQQAGPSDEAGPQVETAPHAARVGAYEAVAGVGQAELVEHRVALAAAVWRSWPNSRATITRFSRPVIASSTAAYWPARPMMRRTWRGSRSTSIPPTCRDHRRGAAAWPRC